MTATNDTVIYQSIQTICNSTGLTQQDARSLILYSGITYNLEHLNECPLLIIRGRFQTGKTTAMIMAQELVYNAQDTVTVSSGPSLRDAMKENTTLFIEEADDIDEKWFMNRHSRNNPVTFKERLPSGAFIQSSRKLFGATIIHRRKPFQDPAAESRCLILETIVKDSDSLMPYIRGSLIPLRATLQSYLFPFQDIINLPAGRSEYNWGLLKLFNLALPYDPSWDEYVETKIAQASDTTIQGREDEPAVLTWSAVTELAIVEYDGFPEKRMIKARVLLRDVTTKMWETKIMFTPWQVGQLIRQIGFQIVRKGSQQWVYIESLDQIQDIAKSLDIEVDWGP